MLLKSSHNYRLGGQLILLIVSSNMSCPLDWLDDDDGGGGLQTTERRRQKLIYFDNAD